MIGIEIGIGQVSCGGKTHRVTMPTIGTGLVCSERLTKHGHLPGSFEHGETEQRLNVGPADVVELVAPRRRTGNTASTGKFTPGLVTLAGDARQFLDHLLICSLSAGFGHRRLCRLLPALATQLVTMGLLPDRLEQMRASDRLAVSLLPQTTHLG